MSMTSEASTITPLAGCSADRPVRHVVDEPAPGRRLVRSRVPASRRATALRCERSRLAAAGTSPGRGQHREGRSAGTPPAALRRNESDRDHPEGQPERVRWASANDSDSAIASAGKFRIVQGEHAVLGEVTRVPVTASYGSPPAGLIRPPVSLPLVVAGARHTDGHQHQSHNS